MLKTYIAGVMLGIAAVVALLHYVPAVDLERETSLITVTPNGGNAEAFHVNLPGDRIMARRAGDGEAIPAGLEWPGEGSFGDLSAELFKLRNARDAVVGIASRISTRGAATEWVLHLPARGSIYVLLEPAAGAEGRLGILRAGTREFEQLNGSLTERRLSAAGDDPARAEGRLELVATYLTPETAP